jgi:histone-lysine N-methyltransferase SETD7
MLLYFPIKVSILNESIYLMPLENGVMVSAIFRSAFDCTANSNTEEKYHFDESTATHLSSQPLLRDPYEAQYCYTKRSTISEAGDGLFARRDVPDNFVIAFYNGFRLPIHQIDRRKWEQNQYTLQIDDDVVVDLDPYHSKTSHYCATLGHKANCLIGQQANAKYDFYYHHPRFGKIKCIRTLRPIKKDEEIFVDYGTIIWSRFFLGFLKNTPIQI